MNYQQALDYVFGYIDYEKQPMPHAMGSYDLRRVAELLERMGNPHQKRPSVHIGGTNGKGSTAAMIASVLQTSGYTTALYTSPHLHTIQERFKINGNPISEAGFTATVTELRPHVEAVNREATYGALTTFEVLTSLAFSYFQSMGVDFQVLEVGMGGRYDATNVITPEVSIITSISLDHTQVLGNSLAKIAGEKAGIIKPGTPVILAPQADEARRVIAETCEEKDAELFQVGRDIVWENPEFCGVRQSLTIKGRLNTYDVAIPLLGRYQLDNTAAAIGALEVLISKGFKITSEGIREGLAQVSWPGRLQVLNSKPLIVVDGAHNPDAARRLRLSVTEYFRFGQAFLIIGASQDKDIDGIAAELGPLFDGVIATRSHHPRAMDPARIESAFQACGIRVTKTGDIREALSLTTSQTKSQDLICIAGSLFTVAEATEQIESLGYASEIQA